MWSALSDERTGLSFKIAVGARQRSHSRTLVPWGWGQHFTVSHLRLPFSSLPTTHRATVEVFNPFSAWDLTPVDSDSSESESESESYVTTDGQSSSLTWDEAPIWGLRPDIYYCLTVTGLLMCGVFSDERTRSLIYNSC
jgi:hypothetical protein